MYIAISEIYITVIFISLQYIFYYLSSTSSFANSRFHKVLRSVIYSLSRISVFKFYKGRFIFPSVEILALRVTIHFQLSINEHSEEYTTVIFTFITVLYYLSKSLSLI